MKAALLPVVSFTGAVLLIAAAVYVALEMTWSAFCPRPASPAVVAPAGQRMLMAGFPPK